MDNKEQLSAPVVQMQPLVLPQTTAELTAIQKGYLALSHRREILFKNLQAGELAVQSFLNDISNDKDIASVQKKIGSAKEIISADIAQRLLFTNLLKEKVVMPSMEFEKRNETLLAVAAAHELVLRKEAAAKAQEGNALKQEETAFTTHFTNEFYSVAAEYRQTMAHWCHHYYQEALRRKEPVKTIQAYIEATKPILLAFAPRPLTPFPNRTLVTPERAKELYGSITKYNHLEDQAAALKSFESLFVMYAQDLKNAEAAIASSQTSLNTAVQQEQQAVIMETSVNNLVASAGAVIEGPVIKVQVKAALEQSEQYALKVLSATIKNWNSIKKFIKVKKWTNLSVEQMAEALAKLVSETGVPVAGLETVEIEK